MKKPKFLTLRNINQALFFLSSFIGLVLIFINQELASTFIQTSYVLLAYLVYSEVYQLKDWGHKNLESLVTTAEITARAAYKLKQRGVKVTVNGKEIES